MTKMKISLFAGAAVVIAVGLVWAIRTNQPVSNNDGRGTIGAAEIYKADVSMAFRAGDTQMTSGAYNFKVSYSAGIKQIVVQKADGSASAILLPTPGDDAPKAWRQEGKPKISFSCLDGACSLARFWNGQDVSTSDFPAPKLSAAEKERLAAITVGLTRAD